MAVITNYATLTTAVQDYLARDDLNTWVPNFIQNAENKIYRRFMHRGLEAALSGTISGGVLALPTNYVALKYAYVNDSPVCRLSKVPPEMIYEKYPVRSGTTGVPVLIAREASNFIFGPYPADKSIVGIYYKRPDRLSRAESTTNWYTDNAPEVLLYGALVEAEPFIRNDERLALWAQLFGDAIKSVMDEEATESATLGSLQTRLA